MQGRNVVLEAKFGPPRIVNDGVTVAREVELEDPVENIGARLVRQAAARTNDTAGTAKQTVLVTTQLELSTHAMHGLYCSDKSRHAMMASALSNVSLSYISCQK